MKMYKTIVPFFFLAFFLFHWGLPSVSACSLPAEKREFVYFRGNDFLKGSSIENELRLRQKIGGQSFVVIGSEDRLTLVTIFPPLGDEGCETKIIEIFPNT